MSPEQKMVQEFHEKFGALVNTQPTLVDNSTLLLRGSLIVEEAGEFLNAARKGDLVKMADAIADVLVVTYGTAVTLGLDMSPIFEEVHRSNMSKDGGGKDAGGKIQKGPLFVEPDIKNELMKQGWTE